MEDVWRLPTNYHLESVVYFLDDSKIPAEDFFEEDQRIILVSIADSKGNFDPAAYVSRPDIHQAPLQEDMFARLRNAKKGKIGSVFFQDPRYKGTEEGREEMSFSKLEKFGRPLDFNDMTLRACNRLNDRNNAQ